MVNAVIADLYPIIYVWRNLIQNGHDNQRVKFFGQLVFTVGSEMDQQIACSKGYKIPLCGTLKVNGLKNILKSESTLTTDEHFKRLLVDYLQKHGDSIDSVFSILIPEQHIHKLICFTLKNYFKTEKVPVTELISAVKLIYHIDLDLLSKKCLIISTVVLLINLKVKIVDDGKYVINEFKLKKERVEQDSKGTSHLSVCETAPLLVLTESSKQCVINLLNIWATWMKESGKCDTARMKRFSYFAFHIGSDKHKEFAIRRQMNPPLCGFFTTSKARRLLSDEMNKNDVPLGLKNMINKVINLL